MSTGKILAGYAVFGVVMGMERSIGDKEYATIASEVLLGKYDEHLLLSFRHSGFEDPELALRELKADVRGLIQEAFDRLNEHAAQRRMVEINQPHAAGTTAELAEKLGVSKSEVRRMRAAGTLDQALNA